MENSSYALYIVIGTLVAIVVLSLILFRWKQIGSLESEKDSVLAVKNKSEFNAEFEAYNKHLMYGADVLSCLNKAQNNNQKYVYNNYYGTGIGTSAKADKEEHFIDVEVETLSPLYDEIKAYYKDNAGKYQRAFGNKDDLGDMYKDDIFSGGVNSFKKIEVYYYYFEGGVLKQTSSDYVSIMGGFRVSLQSILRKNGGKITTKFSAGTYHLLTDEDVSGKGSSDAAMLSALISTVNIKNQVLTRDPSPSDSTGWWYCNWTTAAYDFKSRKFKCVDTVYNEDTGYIEKISFEEYQ